MESVRNWLEQTIGMPIDYICIIIMGMLTLHVLIRIAIHGNMEFLKKYGKSGNDTEKKINDPSKERNDSSSARFNFFFKELPTVFAPQCNLTQTNLCKQEKNTKAGNT